MPLFLSPILQLDAFHGWIWGTLNSEWDAFSPCNFFMYQMPLHWHGDVNVVSSKTFLFAMMYFFGRSKYEKYHHNGEANNNILPLAISCIDSDICWIWQFFSIHMVYLLYRIEFAIFFRYYSDRARWNSFGVARNMPINWWNFIIDWLILFSFLCATLSTSPRSFLPFPLPFCLARSLSLSPLFLSFSPWSLLFLVYPDRLLDCLCSYSSFI